MWPTFQLNRQKPKPGNQTITKRPDNKGDVQHVETETGRKGNKRDQFTRRSGRFIQNRVRGFRSATCLRSQRWPLLMVCEKKVPPSQLLCVETFTRWALHWRVCMQACKATGARQRETPCKHNPVEIGIPDAGQVCEHDFPEPFFFYCFNHIVAISQVFLKRAINVNVLIAVSQIQSKRCFFKIAFQT